MFRFNLVWNTICFPTVTSSFNRFHFFHLLTPPPTDLHIQLTASFFAALTARQRTSDRHLLLRSQPRIPALRLHPAVPRALDERRGTSDQGLPVRRGRAGQPTQTAEGPRPEIIWGQHLHPTFGFSISKQWSYFSEAAAPGKIESFVAGTSKSAFSSGFVCIVVFNVAFVTVFCHLGAF